jgi:cytolysin (calcineurin-like family phosphatase)
MCPCNGYPRIDWYRGKERLAIVSVQHCKAIRWKGFQADATLTSKSSQWLQEWLADHGVDREKMK